MKFSIQDANKVVPKLCDLIPGTMVLVDDVVYIKVDKQKTQFDVNNANGIPRITWTADYCVLLNPDDGKLIQLSATTRLNVVTPTEGGSISVEDISHSTKLYQFLRTNQGNM